MKKIAILLVFITLSFNQSISSRDITISVDNSMQSIDINSYVPLISGYYKVDPIFTDSFSGTIENVSVTFQWDTAPFYSEFGMQRNYDVDFGVDIGVYDEATISAQNSILNILWADDYVNESISFDIVIRVTGIFDDNTSGGDGDLSNDNSGIPSGYSLNNPYPNPFNPTVNVSFDIPNNDIVLIKIYDLRGKLISTLVEDIFVAGKHNLTWDASEYPSGQYFVNMKSGKYTKTQKITLIK